MKHLQRAPADTEIWASRGRTRSSGLSLTMHLCLLSKWTLVAVHNVNLSRWSLTSTYMPSSFWEIYWTCSSLHAVRSTGEVKGWDSHSDTCLLQVGVDCSRKTTTSSTPVEGKRAQAQSSPVTSCDRPDVLENSNQTWGFPPIWTTTMCLRRRLKKWGKRGTSTLSALWGSKIKFKLSDTKSKDCYDKGILSVVPKIKKGRLYLW